MIELFEKNMVSPQRKSSKRNQLKWAKDSIWYKNAPYVFSQHTEHFSFHTELRTDLYFSAETL